MLNSFFSNNFTKNSHFYKKSVAVIGLTAIFASGYAMADKPVLNILTYDSFTSKYGPAKTLKDNFEKNCNCEVKFNSFESALSMFNRIRLDKNKAKADLVIGLESGSIDDAYASKLFANAKVTPQYPLLKPILQQSFVPYDFGDFAFIYNSKTFKHKLPTSLAELAADKNISIIYQDPRTSSVGRGLLYWVNSTSNPAQIWQQLKSHTVTVANSWSSSYNAFLKGEADMVLSYVSSPVYHILYEQNNDYKALIFKDGHVDQIEYMAKLNNATNHDLADSFMQYILTPEAQSVLAKTNIMQPVIKTKIDPAFDSLPTVKSIKLNPSKEQVSTWTNQWLNLMAQ